MEDDVIQVKVCGMTNPEDALAVSDLGADFAGFIFHPPSPRNVGPELPAALDMGSTRKVGVFVAQSPDEVLDIMEAGDLHLAQLHGGQDADFCRAVGMNQVIKVLWPERYERSEDLLRDMETFAPVCRYLLLDAGSSGGGHGRAMDFSRLANIVPPCPWLLAGGLGPDNLAEAIEACDPDGVDLNSGVESTPGKKDPVKLKTALGIVRGDQ